jgi:hypothetical protein
MIPAHMATFWHVAQAAPIQGTQLADVLRDNAPAGCCIDCLAAKLDFPVKELRDAAQVLVMRPAFRVFERECYICGFVKDSVVMFVGRGLPVQ